jgi:hypothetical protein
MDDGTIVLLHRCSAGSTMLSHHPSDDLTRYTGPQEGVGLGASITDSLRAVDATESIRGRVFSLDPLHRATGTHQLRVSLLSRPVPLF